MSNVTKIKQNISFVKTHCKINIQNTWQEIVKTTPSGSHRITTEYSKFLYNWPQLFQPCWRHPIPKADTGQRRSQSDQLCLFARNDECMNRHPAEHTKQWSQWQLLRKMPKKTTCLAFKVAKTCALYRVFMRNVHPFSNDQQNVINITLQESLHYNEHMTELQTKRGRGLCNNNLDKKRMEQFRILVKGPNHGTWARWEMP